MKLYHLLPTQFALQNLRHRRLKIAQINDLNDPFELIAVDHSNKEERLIWRGWKKDQEEKWGALCFSKSWRNPVLWSHYGDKHKGMCLGFEVSDDLLMPIRYTKKRIKVDIAQYLVLGKLDTKLMSTLLRTKFFDWRYEKEVRIFASLKIKDQETGLFFCDFNEKLRLVEVITGPLCDETEETIRSCLRHEDCGVKLTKSRLAFQSFDVVENKQGFSNST